MKKRYILLGVFFILALLLISLGAVYFTFSENLLLPRERVKVIYVEGVLVTGDISPGFGFASSESIGAELRRAARDDHVKAIVMRINSPGGTPAASQEIVDEMKRIKNR
jgi:protease-4